MKYIILVLSIVVISSCTSRENYDPLITDMEACQELIKVKNCLDKFDRQFDLWNYTEKVLKHSFPEYTLEEIKIAIAHCWPKNESIPVYYACTIYSTLYESSKVPKSKAQKMYEIGKMTDFSEFFTYLEKYLYTQCKSKVILKEEVKFPDEYLFIDDVLKQIMSIFNSCNMPAIDYSELLNDDEKYYQVWAISKESDIHRKNDTKITVFFNDKNKRTYMRLFHSR